MSTHPLDYVRRSAMAIFRCHSMLAAIVLPVVLLTAGAGSALAQSADTGALNGTVTDPSGKVVSGVTVKLSNVATGETRTAITQGNGNYLIPLLPPGKYNLEASRRDFKTALVQGVQATVTETTKLDIQLQLGAITERVTVNANPEQLETTSVALGHVTDQRMVSDLPLVSRNYTQIIGLSPGVANEVTDATTVGPGGGGLSAGTTGFAAHGSATNDNNYQMNGAPVNDLMAAGNLSGGAPIPSPDTIQEFKVQTSQYDASYGRNAGANVDVITKAGSNDFHGTAFEFFRNGVLNANNFFLNKNGQPRPPLNQNQFGFTLGGPIKKDKLLFFVSYQGTRQKNGYDTNAACLETSSSPPLTNDRSRQALGALFAGQPGALGGVILPDGSNIDSVALTLMQAKLANGSFLIPTPQTINPALPFSIQGSSSITLPCDYSENQFTTNADFIHTSRSRLTGRFFFSNGDQSVPLPPNQLIAAPTYPGFPRGLGTDFRDLSLTYTFVFSQSLLNQALFGYSRIFSDLSQGYPLVALPGQSSPVLFNFSNIGVTAPSFTNDFPAIATLGAGALGGNGQGVQLAQNNYTFQDGLTYIRGRHTLYFGGGVSRTQINEDKFHFIGGIVFVNFNDFLLGHAFESVDVPGLYDRAWRTWDGNLYAQDNFRATSRLTLNLGFRWERLGALGDDLGRSSIFDPALANPNPPPTGTLQGYVVASNYSGGTIPAGVTQSGNNSATHQDGQNGWAPRIGLAWQIPRTDRFVLRAGYGIYYSRTTGQPVLQLLTAPPFGEQRVLGFGITQLTPLPFANPFSPTAPVLPSFPAYSPKTQETIFTLSPGFRPPIVQQYSMNMQAQLAHNLVLEVGYEGARGTRLELDRSFNQALSASSANPIRGQTNNTFSNIPLRVPIEGFSAGSALTVDSIGSSWYNALNVSLNKRFSQGLQLLASYTWASNLSDSPGYNTGPNGGVLSGDSNNPRAAYGPSSFVRPQRFVVSYLYDFPGFKEFSSLKSKFLGGWAVSGVTIFQSGQRLTITDTNVLNAFGIVATGDRAQLAAGCKPSGLVTTGSVNSKLNNYFNAACFTTPPVIGADGLATGFGNSGTGIVSGPAQGNFDMAIIKNTRLFASREGLNLQFRAEFFNAFNTSQFANPDTNLGTVTINPATFQPILAQNPTFGQIRATSVNPRIIQFGLKLSF